MATRSVKLPNAEWADLGLGPAFLSAYGDEVCFALGAAAPKDEIGHILRFESNPVKISTQERIWARSLPGGRYARAVVTTLESAPALRPPTSRDLR